MSLAIGIIGLPNVGKSTLFNALTAAGAEAANYPFCTIEPNVGIVDLPDARLARLVEIAQSQRIMRAPVKFVDIAGLVKGASRGEGLGNRFLAHIREVDAIAHVVRCFTDDDVAHVSGTVDPAGDMATINLELILADLETVERQVPLSHKAARSGDAKVAAQARLLTRLQEALDAGRPARSLTYTDEELELLRPLHLLTSKPVMYVANVAEDELAAALADPDSHPHVRSVRAAAAAEGASVAIVSARIEAELADLTPSERVMFLQELGVEQSGLERVIRTGFELLGLITFFTVGPKEVRAWTIRQGTKAAQAAGVIHTDFERGFIRAEVTSYSDLAALGSEKATREQGLMRLEGRDYVVQDGDVCHFRFNV